MMLNALILTEPEGAHLNCCQAGWSLGWVQPPSIILKLVVVIEPGWARLYCQACRCQCLAEPPRTILKVLLVLTLTDPEMGTPALLPGRLESARGSASILLSKASGSAKRSSSAAVSAPTACKHAAHQCVFCCMMLNLPSKLVSCTTC